MSREAVIVNRLSYFRLVQHKALTSFWIGSSTEGPNCSAEKL
jgi:hypothetical protein